MWRVPQRRRGSQGEVGGWSGYFNNDAAPDTLFDITEWIDRGQARPIVRYSYQVRYCNGLADGLPWQYRLDCHPIDDPAIAVPHHHDHAAHEAEHDPRPGGPYLSLSQALPLLERQVFSRIGPCADRVPGLHGRAPFEPGTGAVVIEP